jgi:hypothetical protein
MALLTRSDFESAVKDALRHYTQTDLLAENALLRARLLTRSEGHGSDTDAAGVSGGNGKDLVHQ